MANEKKGVSPLKMFLLATVAFAVYVGGQLGISYYRVKKDVDRIRHIVASEELILQLNGELAKLSRSVWNLSFPDHRSRALFLDTIQIVDVGRPSSQPSGDGDAATIDWTLNDTDTATNKESQLTLWGSLFDTISHFEHARFYFVRGEFDDASNLDSFASTVGFKGLAQRPDGQWVGVRSKQLVRWKRTDKQASSENADQWRIASWKVKSFSTSVSPKLMFAEALAHAVPTDTQLGRLRYSEHEEAVNEYYATGARRLPWKYFTPISANQRPGVSVVDVDQDGFDDLYVMVRRGRNQLLRNRGDGTFEEVAQQWGLDIENFSSCGIFADFDNDGDPDLMLGRSVANSLYLENTGERYRQKRVSETSNTLPRLVVSMSAVDYNRDGLLDVYFSTYRPAVLESLISESDTDDADDAWESKIVDDSKRWPAEFLAPDTAKRYEAKVAATQEEAESFGKILDQVGPPNVLLVNRGGGKFDIAPESEQLAVWRNTLQATWADFDQDGDADLYIANDWATDNLFRNDAGSFTEISAEMGTTEFGFGMGVTWGDYDRDGRQDLYVSNMYSKAGRRIMAQIAELNPNFQRSVAGNYLYRSTDDGFQLVSGLEPPAIPVAEAGWSWGGQFSDFNNDGFLDLYVLSGYFTAPAEHASNVDL